MLTCLKPFACAIAVYPEPGTFRRRRRRPQLPSNTVPADSNLERRGRGNFRFGNEGGMQSGSGGGGKGGGKGGGNRAEREAERALDRRRPYTLGISIGTSSGKSSRSTSPLLAT